MAHPFFESGVYPWWIKPAADDFWRALHQLYPQPAIIDLKYRSFDGTLPPLNLNPGPHLIWKEVLDTFGTRGYIKPLCEAVRADFQRTAVNAQVLHAIFDASDPVKTVIFPSGEIVMDRKSLRAHLSAMEAQQSSKRVVLVRGDPSSGKSWGRHLFFEIANAHGVPPIYLGDGIVATVDEVIDAISVEFDPPADQKVPAKQTTEDAWYRAVCFWFKKLAIKSNKTLWIAVDDLGAAQDNTPLLDPRIKDFFDQFVLQMANPSFRRWFRLMLIHYPEGSVPTQWKQVNWAEDRPRESDVQQEEVAEVIRERVRQNQRTLVEDQVQKLAEAVIFSADHPLPGDSRPRLARIHDALTVSLQAL